MNTEMLLEVSLQRLKVGVAQFLLS